MKNENYVKAKSQSNLTTSKADIPVRNLNASELQKSRNILEQDGEKYTDEEIEIIYYFLKEMAELSISHYSKTNNYEESNSNVQG